MLRADSRRHTQFLAGGAREMKIWSFGRISRTPCGAFEFTRRFDWWRHAHKQFEWLGMCVCGGALNRSTPQMILNHWKQKDICSLFARGSLTLNLIKNTRMAIQASFPNAHCLRSVWLRPAWPGAPLAAILHWIPILISSSAAVFVSQLICKFLNLNY